MKPRNLRLFSLLFALFGFTTLLMAGFIVLGSFTMPESRAISFVESKHDELVAMMVKVLQGPLTVEELKQAVKESKVDLLVIHQGKQVATKQNFPQPQTLIESAQQIGSLYFSKYNGRYYLVLHQQESWVVATAMLANLLVYSDSLVYWPWVAALLLLIFNYLMLIRLLRPVKDAIQCAQQVSAGALDYRIKRHPKNELATLTQGLNNMTSVLQRLVESKDELLLAISHELRTPMARMKISLAMLDESDTKEELTNDIEYMNLLIEQLLEGERLQQGNKALHKVDFFLPTLIDEVINEQGCIERIKIAGSVPEEVITIDVGRIKFLLRNLLGNALQYSSADSMVTLSIAHSDEGFLFKITDQGVGIPESELDKIFEPFHCGEHIDNRSVCGASNNQGAGQGVGLGLYLCRRIAIAHNGTLTVESTVDTGSCFTLLLPADLH